MRRREGDGETGYRKVVLKEGNVECLLGGERGEGKGMERYNIGKK